MGMCRGATFILLSLAQFPPTSLFIFHNSLFSCMPQQYVVPQFLTVEPKIIGPITMRQFVILLGTALLIAINFKLLTLWYSIPLSLFEFGLAALFAFYKVNGLPFQYFVLNYLQNLKRPNVRVSSKEYTKKELKVFMSMKAPELPEAALARVRPTESRLAKLSLIVNTGGAFSPDDQKVLEPMKFEKKK